ncbi:MAG: hypothetical protein ACOZBZ_04680 [Patescibacteria group bacterium]
MSIEAPKGKDSALRSVGEIIEEKMRAHGPWTPEDEAEINIIANKLAERRHHSQNPEEEHQLCCRDWEDAEIIYTALDFHPNGHL